MEIDLRFGERERERVSHKSRWLGSSVCVYVQTSTNAKRIIEVAYQTNVRDM